MTKSLFEFADYKLWIKQAIRSKPQGGRGELTRLAQHLRIHSTLVGQILKREKDFTIEQAQALTDYYGLNEIEAEYFVLLVQKNRAGTMKLRAFFQLQIERAKRRSLDMQTRLPIDRQLTLEESAIFYSSWLYSAVRVFTSIGDGKTITEIQSHFHLTPELAASVVEFLVGASLCRESKGVYTVGPQRTHLAQNSPLLPAHLANWRTKALESAKNLGENELMYSSCLSMSESDFNSLRETFADAIKSVQLRVAETDPEHLVIFNLDWTRLKP